jgi:hypothetical protein
VRTTVPEPLPDNGTGTEQPSGQEPAEPADEPAEPDDPADEPDRVRDGEPDGRSDRDEDADRREYAPDASGEVTDDANDTLLVPAEDGADDRKGAAPENGGEVNVAQEGADKTATETVPADEADKTAAGEEGAVADSVLTYYLTLLDSRLGALFECKRFYVYWETAEDHRTVFKTSPEHQLILLAGAYDVSAKLLEENLTVDDGWITRTNPDAVVKVVDGALDAAAAQSLCAELAARPDWAATPAVRSWRMLVLSGELLQSASGRTADAVYLAKLLYPEQMQDVDADEALRALSEESAGRAPSGLYAYTI